MLTVVVAVSVSFLFCIIDNVRIRLDRSPVGGSGRQFIIVCQARVTFARTVISKANFSCDVCAYQKHDYFRAKYKLNRGLLSIIVITVDLLLLLLLLIPYSLKPGLAGLVFSLHSTGGTATFFYILPILYRFSLTVCINFLFV